MDTEVSGRGGETAPLRVLVTGGAGFIGSHVARALLAAGHQVTVLDDLSSGCASNVPPGAGLVEGDIRSPDLAAVLSRVRPDGVVHCAAQVSVGASVEDPLNDMERNITGTARLLVAGAAAGVRSFVYASSAAVYGTPEKVPISEGHPTLPLSPYGLSKLTAERYVRLLGAQLGLKWVCLRYANVYGPGQRASGDGAVVPAFLEAFAAGRDPIIHGDGEQTRDFVYVTDVARANLLALTGRTTGVFNVGSGTAVSINALWKAGAALMGWNRPPVYGPPRPGDIRDSVLSPVAAASELGWAPAITLEDGLRRTVAARKATAPV